MAYNWPDMGPPPPTNSPSKGNGRRQRSIDVDETLCGGVQEANPGCKVWSEPKCLQERPAGNCVLPGQKRERLCWSPRILEQVDEMDIFLNGSAWHSVGLVCLDQTKMAGHCPVYTGGLYGRRPSIPDIAFPFHLRMMHKGFTDLSLLDPRREPCVSAKVQIRKRQQEQDIEAALQREYILIDKTSKASGLTADWVEHRISVESQVGDLSGEGFGTGLAPTSVKSKKLKKKNKETTGSTKKERAPVVGKDPEMIAQAKEPVPDVPAKPIAQREQDAANAESLSLSGSIVKAEEIGPSTPPQKSVMFEMFKAGKGREINRILIENRSILIERRKRMKELTERINNTKEEIDITKRSLNIKKRGREDEGEYMNEQDEPIVDEDEFNLIIQLKDLKQQYRQGFDVLQDLRVEVQYCQKLVVQCRLRLLTRFDIWYNESSLISSDTQLAPQMDNIRPGLVPYPTMISLEEDDKEKFQHIQHEILVLNPESVSFYKARMKLEQSHNYIKVVAQPQPITIKKKPGKITSTTKNKPPSNLQCH
ncbi:LOW QUALITY PROTEIN: kinesin-like protein KIF9 [Hemitrygon akajei]|uniref:LOW QUALITY PROTEIN: kinesin-like protein KIF9 n=1 Tax=Hemitrygon akajei TaxID=2704970 RepID=UPI003BFA0864